MIKIKHVFFIFGIIVMSACSKNEVSPTVSVSDSKSLVASAGTNVQTSHDEFVNTDAIKAIAILDDFNYLGDYAPGDPTTLTGVGSRKAGGNNIALSRMRSAIKKHIPNAYNRILLDVIDPDFNTAVGVYEYNSTTSGFDKTSTGGSSVVIKFPYPKTNSTNNAVYTISKYQTANVNGALMPASFEANLQVNSLTILTISVAATYDSDGNPNTLNAVYAFGDKSIKINFNNSSTQISLSFLYLKGTTTVLGTTYTINFEDSNKNNAALITFDYILGDVTLKGNYDIAGLLSDPALTSVTTAEQAYAIYDKYIKIELDRTSDGVKLADIKIRKNNNVAAFVIIYSDGTQGDFSVIENAFQNAGFANVIGN